MIQQQSYLKVADNTGDLKHDSAGLNNGNPILGSTFTGTHSGFSGLLGYRLVGENLYPDLTATLDVTGHCDTGCLDLVSGDPGGLESYETEIAVRDLVASHGLTGHSASLYPAVLNSLG